MADTSIDSEYRNIVKLFRELTGSRSMWQVFDDCIEAFALCFQDKFATGKKFDENEERYKRIINQYSAQEIRTIAKILAELTNMAKKNPFRDLLGGLYMQLDMGSSDLGQFFTPYDMSYTMAGINISIDEIKSKISEKGYITIYEPTCGSGVNVIAFCEHLYKNDINYQSQCVIVCQELSHSVALMCYVTLSLLGCSAVIKIGNTLVNPFTSYYDEVLKGSELWTTPMFHIHNCYNKC